MTGGPSGRAVRASRRPCVVGRAGRAGTVGRAGASTCRLAAAALGAGAAGLGLSTESAGYAKKSRAKDAVRHLA